MIVVQNQTRVTHICCCSFSSPLTCIVFRDRFQTGPYIAFANCYIIPYSSIHKAYTLHTALALFIHRQKGHFFAFAFAPRCLSVCRLGVRCLPIAPDYGSHVCLACVCVYRRCCALANANNHIMICRSLEHNSHFFAPLTDIHYISAMLCAIADAIVHVAPIHRIAYFY